MIYAFEYYDSDNGKGFVISLNKEELKKVRKEMILAKTIKSEDVGRIVKLKQEVTFLDKDIDL
jgi:hypothetical protein